VGSDQVPRGHRNIIPASESLTPDRILTREAFTNVLRMMLAIGGSTNAVIHVAALDG
jgi:dihydroxy-acid dehydratase